jgi:Mrp family chromosome partitioning ATPase
LGEIADALKRARSERVERVGESEGREARSAEAGVPEAVYSRALEVQSPDALAEATTQGRATADPAGDAGPRVVDVQIPRERSGDWAGRTVVVEDGATDAESYRHFAIRLSRAMERRRIRTVMLVSGLRHEGKTTTSCNLALACASMGGGRRIALLDFDLRRPTVARALGVVPRTGFDVVLDGHALLADARLRTDIAEFDVYPVVSAVAQPHEVLSHPRVGEILAELERDYDTIVIDTAPLLLVPDSELLFPHTGGVVTVLRSRQTKRAAFKELVAMIPDGKLLGSFMNDSRPSKHEKQYAYYQRESDDASSQPQST